MLEGDELSACRVDRAPVRWTLGVEAEIALLISIYR